MCMFFNSADKFDVMCMFLNSAEVLNVILLNEWLVCYTCTKKYNHVDTRGVKFFDCTVIYT